MERNEARARKLKRYSTGRACSQGHFSDRYTSTGNCVACQAEQRTKVNQLLLADAEGWSDFRARIPEDRVAMVRALINRACSPRYGAAVRASLAGALRMWDGVEFEDVVPVQVYPVTAKGKAHIPTAEERAGQLDEGVAPPRGVRFDMGVGQGQPALGGGPSAPQFHPRYLEALERDPEDGTYDHMIAMDDNGLPCGYIQPDGSVERTPHEH